MGTQGAYPRVRDGRMGLTIAYVRSEGTGGFLLFEFFMSLEDSSTVAGTENTDKLTMKSHRDILHFFQSIHL